MGKWRRKEDGTEASGEGVGAVLTRQPACMTQLIGGWARPCSMDITRALAFHDSSVGANGRSGARCVDASNTSPSLQRSFGRVALHSKLRCSCLWFLLTRAAAKSD
jgi:hypothetical protein